MKFHYKYFVSLIAALLIMNGCAAKSPLMKASSDGDYQAVQKLVQSGVNINEADSNGASALMHATWSKKPDVAKYLIESGADIKPKDTGGLDALSYAAEAGQLEIMSILIDKGADINSRDKVGKTPLIHAVHVNIDTVRLLIKKGANINAKDANNETALDIALPYRKIDILAALIDAGADINTLNKDGKTPPLIYAIEQVLNIDMVKLLIKKGANVNAKNANNETVMDLALSNRRMDIVMELLNAGVKLFEPETGNVRLFFIGEDLYDYVSVKIGNRSQDLNRGSGFNIVDVYPGNHTISADYTGTKKAKQTLSIQTIAGQAYYFKITQNIKNRIIGYAFFVPATSVDRISGTTPFVITPLKESEAKEKIKEILKLKDLNEAKKSDSSVSTEIAKPTLHKPTDAEVEKNSSDSSGYAQKLRELKKLKEEGLLTDEEYEQKRKAIVDGM